MLQIFVMYLDKNYNVKTGYLESHEIDFVATKSNETIYIQVTLRMEKDKTIEREFGNLLKIKDNYPKIVITMNHRTPNSYKGITMMTVREFLLS